MWSWECVCVCVCVCVHMHKHIPWPAFPIGSTKARSVGWCDFPWDAAGWDQHDCLQTSFFCVKSAWNFDWKRLFFLTLPPLSYIRLLATVLLGSFKVMKWWVEQRRKKGNVCCGKLCCCCSFLSSHWDVITSWRKLGCFKNESQCRVEEGGDGRRIQ